MCVQGAWDTGGSKHRGGGAARAAALGSHHAANATRCSRAADVARVLIAHAQLLLVGQCVLVNRGAAQQRVPKTGRREGWPMGRAPRGAARDTSAGPEGLQCRSGRQGEEARDLKQAGAVGPQPRLHG